MDNFEGHAALDDTLLGNELADVAWEVIADLPSMDETFGPSKSGWTPESAQGKKPEQKEKQKQPELIKTVADLKQWASKNVVWNSSEPPKDLLFRLPKDEKRKWLLFSRPWKNDKGELVNGSTFFQVTKWKFSLYLPTGEMRLYMSEMDETDDTVYILTYHWKWSETITLSYPSKQEIDDALSIFNRELTAYEKIRQAQKDSIVWKPKK